MVVYHYARSLASTLGAITFHSLPCEELCLLAETEMDYGDDQQDMRVDMGDGGGDGQQPGSDHGDDGNAYEDDPMYADVYGDDGGDTGGDAGYGDQHYGNAGDEDEIYGYSGQPNDQQQGDGYGGGEGQPSGDVRHVGQPQNGHEQQNVTTPCGGLRGGSEGHRGHLCLRGGGGLPSPAKSEGGDDRWGGAAAASPEPDWGDPEPGEHRSVPYRSGGMRCRCCPKAAGLVVICASQQPQSWPRLAVFASAGRSTVFYRHTRFFLASQRCLFESRGHRSVQLPHFVMLSGCF